MVEEHVPLAAPLCTEFPSALIENLRKAMGTLDVNDAEAEIEASKVHWSERKSDAFNSEGGSSVESTSTSYPEENLNVAGWVCLLLRRVFLVASELLPLVSKRRKEKEENLKMAKHNVKVFRSLQIKYPGRFFVDEDSIGPLGEMSPGVTERFWKVGLSSKKRFAAGGQAELFYAHVTTDDDNHKKKDESYVMKVFEEGTPLKDLVSNIPDIILTDPYFLGGHCNVMLGARLLKANGRFAFLMERAWGDLRKLINMRKKHVNNAALLFPEDVSVKLIFDIAKGMRELHATNTVHRDLKASNILIYPMDRSCTNFDPITLETNTFRCAVADYECSGGVVGTGFWRAPEILCAVKNRDYHQKPELFSKAADVYSFGMTCYEILSGHIFLEKWGRKDLDRVIGGERPVLPNYTRPWMRDLVTRCWHADPSKRPTFLQVVQTLLVNSH